MQVFDRLSKLNICVSHTATVLTLDKLGIDHDRKAKDWRDELSRQMPTILTKYTNENVSCE